MTDTYLRGLLQMWIYTVISKLNFLANGAGDPDPLNTKGWGGSVLCFPGSRPFLLFQDSGLDLIVPEINIRAI